APSTCPVLQTNAITGIVSLIPRASALLVVGSDGVNELGQFISEGVVGHDRAGSSREGLARAQAVFGTRNAARSKRDLRRRNRPYPRPRYAYADLDWRSPWRDDVRRTIDGGVCGTGPPVRKTRQRLGPESQARNGR